jgi:hypothetical protein
VLLTVWVVGGPIQEALQLGSELSPVADPYSESNAIRGALGYLANGLSSHAGLPETTYGGVHPEIGDLRRHRGEKFVDTHYPPGAMWLTAAAMSICGPGLTPCLRALPITVGALGAFALAFALVVAFGPERGVAAALAAFALPLYSNMMLGLHYQGYALGLLSIQLAVLLLAFASGRPLAARGLALIGGLGFVQGWLSFDYFFLVTLAPLPIAVLFTDLRQREQRRRLLAPVLAGGAGFALAHALHFLQVAAYHGGVAAAARDLFGVAIERADPTLSSGSGAAEFAQHPWMISSVYLFVLAQRDRFLGFSLGNALLLVLGFLFALRGVGLALPGTGLRVATDPSSRPAWAVVGGLLVSCAWISVMPGHAYTHQHFIPRHLFLLWLVMVLAVLRSLRLEARSPGAQA